jgi:hypothetical protein
VPSSPPEVNHPRSTSVSPTRLTWSGECTFVVRYLVSWASSAGVVADMVGADRRGASCERSGFGLSDDSDSARRRRRTTRYDSLERGIEQQRSTGAQLPTHSHRLAPPVPHPCTRTRAPVDTNTMDPYFDFKSYVLTSSPIVRILTVYGAYQGDRDSPTDTVDPLLLLRSSPPHDSPIPAVCLGRAFMGTLRAQGDTGGARGRLGRARGERAGCRGARGCETAGRHGGGGQGEEGIRRESERGD